jgi:RNA polymerase sigma factor (sigma-70 family)
MTGDGLLPKARLDLDDPLPPDDHQAMERLDLAPFYRDQSPRLSRFFARRALPDDVADLVQESFRRLVRASRAGARLEQPEAYLTRIADNLLRDRARTHRSQHIDCHEPFEEDAIAGPDPHHAFEARDSVARLETALATLKPKTREIFLMHRLDDLSYAEIAKARGMSIKGVEKQISKALLLLRRKVGRL